VYLDLERLFLLIGVVAIGLVSEQYLFLLRLIFYQVYEIGKDPLHLVLVTGYLLSLLRIVELIFLVCREHGEGSILIDVLVELFCLYGYLFPLLHDELLLIAYGADGTNIFPSVLLE